MPDEDFGYARSLNGIVERATTNLQDDQEGKSNQKWTREYLQAIACDAFKMFAAADPTLFARDVQFTLNVADKGVHEVPEQCEMLLSIDSIIDDMGHTVNVQRGDWATLGKASYFPSKCPHCRGGKMGRPVAFTIAKNPANPRQFRINPKVRSDTTMKACATCSDTQRFIDDPDLLIDCEFARFIPAMHQWLMYVALTQETGSEAAAEQHRVAFFDLIPYSLKDMRRAASRVGGER